MIHASNGAEATDEPTTSQHLTTLLKGIYADLLEQGVPEHLAELVQRIDVRERKPHFLHRRRALIVEGDPVVRTLAGAVLGESGLAVTECSNAAEGFEFLQAHASEVAFVFVGEDLSGDRDGVQFADAAATLWPQVRIVLTTDGTHPSPGKLSGSVVRIRKPWLGLDLLREAEHSIKAASSRVPLLD